MDLPDPWLAERLANRPKKPPPPDPPAPPAPPAPKLMDNAYIRNLELIKYFSKGQHRRNTLLSRHFNRAIRRAKESLWVHLVVGLRPRPDNSLDNTIYDE